jgi:tRNA1(Val) A37 N6-methylase TrmN6
MFSRVARNFIKNGYFPTDEDTIARILSALVPQSDRPVRICDPCCGEGSALAEVQHHLAGLGAEVASFGIEYDEERAWHAKQLLTRCIHADVNDCKVSLRAFSMLWLNPPYGDLVGDSERSMIGRSGGRKRLEKEFFQRCIHMLQPGGVLVLIVPYTVLDEEFSGWISKHCRDVSVFAAPEQKFRQAVVLGVKRARAVEPEKRVILQLIQAQKNRYCNMEGEWVEGFNQHCVLPEIWNRAPYEVPASTGNADVDFSTVRLDAKQLASEIAASPVLWGRFDSLFRTRTSNVRQPLRKLSEWHLALMLAAGQVSGVVRGISGRTLLVKGDTFKTKKTRTEKEFNEETESVTTTRTATDIFVPMIRGIEFTPDSPNFGRIVHIE